jgi:hypothetical protein
MISAADCTWPEITFGSLEEAEEALASMKLSQAMAEEEGYKGGRLLDDIKELEDLISLCRQNPNF